MQSHSCALIPSLSTGTRNGLAICARARLDVAHQRFGFHDAYIRLFTDDEKIVHNVSPHSAEIAPVVRESYLMHTFALDPKRSHPGRDQNPRLYPCPRSADGCPVPVNQSKFS